MDNATLLSSVADLANTLGVTAVLLWALLLFYRGEILSRRVYEELTERLLTVLSEKLVDRIVSDIVERFEE